MKYLVDQGLLVERKRKRLSHPQIIKWRDMPVHSEDNLRSDLLPHENRTWCWPVCTGSLEAGVSHIQLPTQVSCCRRRLPSVPRLKIYLAQHRFLTPEVADYAQGPGNGR